MLMYQKTMFDFYYCLKSFCLLKNTSKSLFLFYYNGVHKHDGLVGFEKACFSTKTYVILTSLNYAHSYARYC